MARIPVYQPPAPAPPRPAPAPPRPAPAPAPAPAPSSGGGSSGGYSNSGSSGSSGGGDSTPAYIRRAEAREREQERKAAAKYSDQAQRLKNQADLLRIALGKKGFKKALKTQLGNVRLQFNEQDDLILKQYRRGRGELETQVTATERGLSQDTVAALSNAGRERNEALQKGVSNGVGLSDMLRAMSASLRNWSFNQSQVNEAYNDTLNSLNSSNTEMENMVLAQRQGAWRQLEEQRTGLYSDYYDARTRTLTDIGNKLGESASYWGMAQEASGSRLRKAAEKRMERQANAAFRRASLETGRAYDERATPDRITDWEGGDSFENSSASMRFARSGADIKDAEGATLRRWET
jgi:hypothetical protein